MAAGDRVTTLGSVGGRPYVPGIVVGTVTSVDPAQGQLTATAVVRPAVDASRLDIVAVVLPTAPCDDRRRRGREGTVVIPRLSLLGLIRTGAVLVAALTVATVLPRFGLPARFLPGLVVLVVASSAVVRGPGGRPARPGRRVGRRPHATGRVPTRPHGPPVCGGRRQGLAHRAASRSLLGAILGLAAATVVVEIGGVCVAILGDGSFDLGAAATRTLTTLGVGLLALPLLLGVDRGLTRRRLA